MIRLSKKIEEKKENLRSAWTEEQKQRYETLSLELQDIMTYGTPSKMWTQAREDAYNLSLDRLIVDTQDDGAVDLVYLLQGRGTIKKSAI